MREGLESGQHDSYFLITERLSDTLDRRIRAVETGRTYTQEIGRQVIDREDPNVEADDAENKFCPTDIKCARVFT